jgi:hypothetical protein
VAVGIRIKPAYNLLMQPILTESELAELLQVESDLITRLVQETDIPMVQLAGHTRFVTHEVIQWLSHSAQPILRLPLSERSQDELKALKIFSPATAKDEPPFISSEARESLRTVGRDPAYNLLRGQLRDALMAVADELQDSLQTTTQGRLKPYPAEAHRTSPWRAEQGPVDGISSITFAWGEGEDAEPEFLDRPRIALIMTADTLDLQLRVPEPDREREISPLVQNAIDLGGVISLIDETNGWSLTFSYPMDERAPTMRNAVSCLLEGLSLLGQIWLLEISHEH